MSTYILTVITTALTAENTSNIICNVPVKDFVERLSAKSAKYESSGA